MPRRCAIDLEDLGNTCRPNSKGVCRKKTMRSGHRSRRPELAPSGVPWRITREQHLVQLLSPQLRRPEMPRSVRLWQTTGWPSTPPRLLGFERWRRPGQGHLQVLPSQLQTHTLEQQPLLMQLQPSRHLSAPHHGQRRIRLQKSRPTRPERMWIPVHPAFPFCASVALKLAKLPSLLRLLLRPQRTASHRQRRSLLKRMRLRKSAKRTMMNCRPLANCPSGGGQEDRSGPLHWILTSRCLWIQPSGRHGCKSCWKNSWPGAARVLASPRCAGWMVPTRRHSDAAGRPRRQP
mmetsp:Transcript_100430/g.176937  ORF Transcript_100430/g.176937 Transcript_100430/m.176937 type:complete len:291 (-) Transcript_100430:1465-2337(-)